jgi:hypothetical protein
MVNALGLALPLAARISGGAAHVITRGVERRVEHCPSNQTKITA